MAAEHAAAAKALLTKAAVRIDLASVVVDARAPGRIRCTTSSGLVITILDRFEPVAGQIITGLIYHSTGVGRTITRRILDDADSSVDCSAAWKQATAEHEQHVGL